MAQPDLNTAPTRPRRITIRAVLDSLLWVRAGLNAYSLLDDGNAASKVIKAINELAAHLLAAIS
ncbi:hypothetical protein ACIBJI_41915 [Nocardia sp. NPDC050408]|uniref:hypothetical protein n=1 Tax=Nocardia sp. NPDC050408 TaxID=3364319 RepID=UPI00379E1C86